MNTSEHASLRALLAAMPSGGLADVRDTQLQTRTDRKYLLTGDQTLTLLDAVRSQLPDAWVLQVGDDPLPGYSSVYFDTPERLSYLNAARRRRHRFKVRTRTYDSGQCFVEVKTRGRRGQTVKDRRPHPEALSRHLDDPARTFTSQALTRTRSGSPEIVTDLTPVLDTSYRRACVHLPGQAARVTLDTNLTWHADGRTLRVQDLVVVETKTQLRPCAVDRLLWTAGHRPVRISKFGVGLALLEDLPAHRWHDVLRHHLPTRLTTH